MEKDQRYEILAEGEIFQSSAMGVIPANKNFTLSIETVREALKRTNEFRLISIEDVLSTENGLSKSCTANIEYGDTTYSVIFSILPVEDLHLQEFGLANMVEDKDFQIALNQPSCLETSLTFSSSPLKSFQFQLKLLHAIVPDASLVVDFMSYRLLSGKWLRMTAQSSIPPSPDYLYSIHGVYEELDGKTQYWFHTHGLLRCGIVELEILNIFSGAEQMNSLIDNVAKRFLTEPIKENEKFSTGYDGMNINLTWIRHEKILPTLPASTLGGMKDRDYEDDPHLEPSGILYAVEDGNLVSPEIYASTLADDPILFISDEETFRMSELAKERYPYFVSLFTQHSPAKKESFWGNLFKTKDNESEKWSFLVKLGLTTDGANNETEKEHLWFEVRSADNNKVGGELLNQPYWISSLNKGDINTYPIELLTDWIIYDSEENQYTPDSIYQLLDI